MSDHPDFEPAVLDKLESKLGSRVLGDIIDLFCEEGPRRLEAFQVGRQAGDLGASAAALHSIRGSAAMLGLRSLEHLTGRAEALADDGDAKGLEGLVDNLEVAFREAMTLLRDRRQRLES